MQFQDSFCNFLSCAVIISILDTVVLCFMVNNSKQEECLKQIYDISKIILYLPYIKLQKRKGKEKSLYRSTKVIIFSQVLFLYKD